MKKVWFTYGINEKGALSPYEFSYDNGASYDEMQMDRWGNYQPDAGTGLRVNQAFPYTHQDLDQASREARASVWNLTQIGMPSGSTINIDYEQDDYAYVQNKRAMADVPNHQHRR